MKYFVPSGSSPTLNCMSDKFLVDYTQGIGISRPRWNSQQNKQFHDKLQAYFTAYFPDLLIDRDFNAFSDIQHRLSILAQLVTLLKPDYAALQAALDRLNQVTQSLMGKHHRSSGKELALLEQLQITLNQQRYSKQQRLSQIDIMAEGRAHIEQTLARWSSRELSSFSPAGRCYALIQELSWGMSGQIIRSANPSQRRSLLDEVKETLTLGLASDVNASTNTRHYYHDWLVTPPSSGVMEYKEALAWLGDACDIDRQPISYSITQTWRGISLGMPRICSAQRIGYAMVDEAFG